MLRSKGIFLLAIAAMTLVSGVVMAEPFLEKWKKYGGSLKNNQKNEIALRAPKSAENGNTVPITISLSRPISSNQFLEIGVGEEVAITVRPDERFGLREVSTRVRFLKSDHLFARLMNRTGEVASSKFYVNVKKGATIRNGPDMEKKRFRKKIDGNIFKVLISHPMYLNNYIKDARIFTNNGNIKITLTHLSAQNPYFWFRSSGKITTVSINYESLHLVDNQTTTAPPNPSIKSQDITPPTIDIAAAITVDTDIPTVQGRVIDKNRVAQVTVNGIATDLRNGTFKFTRYVPPTGTSVKIEAVDEWGNKSFRTVKLIRAITDTSEVVSFAGLDPTKIIGRSNRNAVALVIGVADYTRAPKAAYADSDAGVFSDYARRALGIPRGSIKILTNDGASRTDLQIAIKQWLRGRIERGKTDVYVFYAGHGLASPDGEDLYLLPYNGAPSLLEETSLKRTELFNVIADANPRSATIFLDTCYSGLSRGEETLLASARPILIAPKQKSAPKGFTVFSAASGKQISSGLDEAKHGLFSYYLMKGMEGPADANSDRQITVGELHAYVRKNVKQQAVRLGREQTPELQGDAERVLVRW